jgi:hypothetical protein
MTSAVELGAALCPQMLLTLADKYDMPALLSKVGGFLQSNVKNLNSSSSSPQYVWKWIPSADKLKLSEVAKACITGLAEEVWADPVIVQLIGDQPGRAELAGMSAEAHQHLLQTVGKQYRDGVLARQEAESLRDEVQELKQQMKPLSAYCDDCRQLTEHKTIYNINHSYSYAICRECTARFGA